MSDKRKFTDVEDLKPLVILLNECWSELNESRVSEAKSDLIEAQIYLDRVIAGGKTVEAMKKLVITFPCLNLRQSGKTVG